jgi:hypothetical protein
MSEVDTNDAFIEVQPMSVDQLAGAFVMIAGAIGSLLLVIWQSKCHCKMNLCYIFSCERRPPNEEEMKSLRDQAKELQSKQSKTEKKEEDVESPELIPRTSSVKITEFPSEEDFKKKKLQEDYLRQKPESSVIIP